MTSKRTITTEVTKTGTYKFYGSVGGNLKSGVYRVEDDGTERLIGFINYGRGRITLHETGLDLRVGKKAEFVEKLNDHDFYAAHLSALAIARRKLENARKYEAEARESLARATEHLTKMTAEFERVALTTNY